MKTQIISYVEGITDREIIIVCRTPFAIQHAKSIGAKRVLFSIRKWKLGFSTEKELASYLRTLRDTGFAMAGSLFGWPPSAVFEQLREKGVLIGKFKEVVWTKPKNPIVYEK